MFANRRKQTSNNLSQSTMLSWLEEGEGGWWRDGDGWGLLYGMPNVAWCACEHFSGYGNFLLGILHRADGGA
jgi:hypothetical protein